MSATLAKSFLPKRAAEHLNALNRGKSTHLNIRRTNLVRKIHRAPYQTLLGFQVVCDRTYAVTKRHANQATP